MTKLTISKQDGSLICGQTIVHDDAFALEVVPTFRSNSWEFNNFQGYVVPEFIFDGSAHEGYEFNTPFYVSSRGGLIGYEIASGRGYIIHGNSFVDDYVDAATDMLQVEFERLATEWKRETAHLSSPSMIAEHSAYQQIIGMGSVAIPMILRDLNEAAAHWYWALRSIARESPIRPEDRGNIDAMRAAWLDWGERHQYI